MSSSLTETKMITGDEYIVHTDLVVQWKITEPTKFLFHAENPEEILLDATSASIRSIIGSSTIDAALTDGKAEIEAETKELLATLVGKYDIGVVILGVKLQDVELPNLKSGLDLRRLRMLEKQKTQKLTELENTKTKKVVKQLVNVTRSFLVQPAKKQPVSNKRLVMYLFSTSSMMNMKIIKKLRVNV